MLLPLLPLASIHTERWRSVSAICKPVFFSGFTLCLSYQSDKQSRLKSASDIFNVPHIRLTINGQHTAWREQCQAQATTSSNSHFDVKRPGLKQTNPLCIKGDSGCFRRECQRRFSK
ncbi:MAG: hypothetical protein BWK80_17320 [Desulfobacteraceae bacterium IS3]|nr:MAG: hypothetical protein BWK80_17320 [Desulfobacteraceae bacterium IS3]